VRLKKDVVRKVAKECRNISAYVSLSNSSDPYPPIEKEKGITREILKIFRAHNLPVVIITKSDIVTRDVDILSSMNAVVSITITTVDDEIAKLLEPNAPPPSKRLKALEKISEKIPCVVRIDPIIPFLNENFKEVLRAVAPFVKQCVFSTLKMRKDNFERLIKAFPYLKEKLEMIYLKKPILIGNAYYLPAQMRAEILTEARKLCQKHGIAFSSCREMMAEMNTAACDGSSWLKTTPQPLHF